MTFAGLSQAQVVCNNLAGQLIQPQSNIGFLLRAEGEAENVSTTTFTCPNSNKTAGVTAEVTLSLPVTSKAIAAPLNVGGNGNSEATLIVTDNNAADPAPLTVAYSGFVTGQLITFSNVTFPANFTATITDVRVNASLAGALNSVVPVGEGILLGQNGIAEYAPGAVTVGQVLRGLAPPTLVPGDALKDTLFLSNGTATGFIFVCQGDAIGIKAPTAAFNITVNEGFPGAFKLQQDPLNNATNQEQGLFTPAGTTVGTANSATQITLTFANVPSTATIYVPTVVSIAGTVAQATLTLASSQVAATSPSGLTLIPPANQNGPVAALPAAVGGIVTAVYTVTATNALQQENFNIPVYFNIPASTTANPLAAQGPITVLESLAPSGALPANGLANSIPLFATTTNTPIPVHSILICNTTLLFPFVSTMNSATGGFDTGIAITNATTDNLGAFPPNSSAASPTNGVCTLNFYGNVTPQVTAVTTPTLGVWTATSTATAGPMPTWANTLSAMISPVTSFTGYAIASCNFLDAHGFAFVTYDAAGPNGLADGYLAVVIPNFNGASIGQ